MLVDSHCHLDFPELAARLPQIMNSMKNEGVVAALCAGVSLEGLPGLIELVESHRNLYASVGVHPEHVEGAEADFDVLVDQAMHPRVVAIGETGLDYYWHKDRPEWQRMRFRTHIRAARKSGKPLIIHMRDAAADTLRIMDEEGASAVGGVMHCFTESLEIAQRAIELGFLISFSGIITFKNALGIKEVARAIALDRILIETDAPFLAPVPYRGKPNEPAYVRHVADEIAALRGIPFAEVAAATTENFRRLFNVTLQ